MLCVVCSQFDVVLIVCPVTQTNKLYSNHFTHSLPGLHPGPVDSHTLNTPQLSSQPINFISEKSVACEKGKYFNHQY